jgi:hypothetical protein
MAFSFDYEVISRIATPLKYVALIVTAICTWISFRYKIDKDADERDKKKLTSTGNLYRNLFAGSLILSIISTGVADYADSQLKTKAEQATTNRINDALRKQKDEYLIGLSTELQQKVIPPIEKQTNNLSAATRALQQQITRTGEDLAISNVEVLISQFQLMFSTRLPQRRGSNEEFLAKLDDYEEFLAKLNDSVRRTCGYDPENPYEPGTFTLEIGAAPKPRDEKPKDDTNRDSCKQAIASRSRFSTSSKFLQELDRVGHLTIQIRIKFSSFEVHGYSEDCTYPVDSFRTVHTCIDFRVAASSANEQADVGLRSEQKSAYLEVERPLSGMAVMLLPGQPFFFDIKLHMPLIIRDTVFQGRNVTARDTDLHSVEVEACDENPTETPEMRDQHLGPFSDTDIIRIVLEGYEKQSRQFYSRTTRTNHRKRQDSRSRSCYAYRYYRYDDDLAWNR